MSLPSSSSSSKSAIVAIATAKSMGVGQLPEHCNVSERDDSEAPAAQTDDDANGDDDPGAVSPMRVSFSEPIGGMRTDVNDRNTADFQTHHPIDGRRPSYTETPEPHPGDPSPAHPSSDHHHNSHTSHAAHDADDTDDIPCYTPPRQRQRWGDTQIAPHTNWGDIFFDLFYVAAAYNLGNVLLADPTLKTGIFTTAGLFLPVLNLWYYKTFYDSRFYYRDDYYHRGYEIIVLLALATTVSHIRPGSIMLQPSKYEDMFLYSVGLSATFIFSMTRYIEVILCRYWLPSSHSGLHPETRYAARNDFVSNVPPLLCYLAAAIYSGTQYFSNTAANRNDDGNDDAYVGTNNSNSTPYYNSTDDQPQRTADDTAHLVRSLKAATEAASQEESSEEDHDYIPVWLLLGGIVTMLASYAVKMCILTTSREDHKARTVPMNVDFAIHRFGEWIMLMLGESVLSLLIVDIVDTTGYHQTFLCGIFSIVLLQYLHFQSAPSEPDQHAIRRSVTSSFYFYVLFQIYSLSLIVLGVSYKMLLLESVHVEVSSSSSGNSSSRHRLFERDLAVESSTTNLSSASERQQNIADLFSGSLAVIFFCLDAMSLVHRGVKTQMHQCECVNTIKKKFLLVALSAGRVVLTVFVATVSQFETDPRRVALIGTLVILGQVCVRLVGGYVFHSSDMREQIAMERVIHYNTSRIHARPEYMDSVRSSGR